jgi:ABC-type lipoprotein release transport system permease subunit
VLSGASVDWQQARFPDVSERAVGPVTEPRTVRFTGANGPVAVSVRPHPSETTNPRDSATIMPPWWYATSVETVEQLGVSSVLVFDSEGGTGGAVPTGRSAPPGTPLLAALPFLLAGVRQLLTVLSIAALGGGVLVLVVVYSVTRMSIRDRHDDIRVVRSTGGSPRKLFAVLCARALGLVVTGVALGYALGVVLTNAVTNLAVVAGLPVTLAGEVTPAVARLLLTLSGVLVLSGLVAGALAAWPTVRTPPAQLRLRTRRQQPRTGGMLTAVGSERTDGGRSTGVVARLRAAFTPQLLDPRAAIPTTATLTVFVFVVLLVGSLWGAFVPLAGTQSGTIVEGGAAHPLNSRVDASTAELLRSEGLNASAEVIYAAVTDGQPYMVRGAEYDAFASVSDSRIIRGRAPRTLDEAVIGRQLASTLDVEVGETMVLGGSVTPGVRRVTVVGVFDAEGTLNDMLVIPLESAQLLATGPDDAHIIRTEDLSAAQQALVGPSDGNRGGIVVTGVDAPSSVARGEPFDVNVSVRNLDETQRSTTLGVRANNETVARQSVTLAPDEESQLTTQVTLSTTGGTTLDVGGYATRVTVFDPNALSIPAELPTTAPPRATLIIPVEAPNGTFLPGVNVSVGSETYTTNGQGVAVATLPREPGTYEITAEKGGYTATSRELRIDDDATRQLSVRLSVTPTVGNAMTKPHVDVQVGNPWETRLNRTLALVSPEGRSTRTVELAAGEVTRVEIPTSEAGLDERLPPGEYQIRVDSVGDEGETVTLASTTYRVQGDRRVLSVVARGASYSPGTPVGQAIENVFGNVQVLFGAIVLLAGFATIGGTTAAFAQAVHARGRTIGIHRATGATDRQVLRMLVRDAVVIALPSTVVGVVVAYLALGVLELSGLLVVFGIRLSIPAVPWLLAMVVVGGVVLSMTSVVVGGLGYLRASPTRLLRLRE